MSIFNFLKQRKESTADIAKKRLQIIVSHQRGGEDEQQDFIPQLQQELITVISKYVKVDEEQVKVELERTGDCSILELNITLPDTVA
jgi:cell division topological specificity factor